MATSTAKTTSRLMFPSEIARGDQVWDAHPGQGRWAPVVASAAADQEVLVWCDADPEPLHLSASRRVQARRSVPAARAAGLPADAGQASGPGYPAAATLEAQGVSDAGAEEATQIEEAVKLDARMAIWYTSDLAAARAAYVAHEHKCTGPACCEDVDMDAHLHSWYAGDLDFVINNL